VGHSDNPLYVLWDRPKTTPYETLVDLGTRAIEKTPVLVNGNPVLTPTGVGTNETDKDRIPGLAFVPFTTKDITRIDGAPLSYYDRWATLNATTYSLLKTRDGMCGAWMFFYLDLLKTQGLSFQNPWVTVRSKEYDSVHEVILLNDWAFVENPDPAHKWTSDRTKLVYLYRNTLAAGDLVDKFSGPAAYLATSRQGDSYQFPNNPNSNAPDVDGNKDAQGNPRTGLKGQTNPHPLSLFEDHTLAGIGGVLYDPSYGVKYDQATEAQQLAAMENTAVAGFGEQQKIPGQPGRHYLHIRKPDGKSLVVAARGPG
jgi:hypothetical protein